MGRLFNAVDAFLDELFGTVCAFPAFHFYPFAFFEVFVMGEKMFDLIEEDLRQVAIFLHVIKVWVGF